MDLFIPKIMVLLVAIALHMAENTRKATKLNNTFVAIFTIYLAGDVIMRIGTLYFPHVFTDSAFLPGYITAALPAFILILSCVQHITEDRKTEVVVAVLFALMSIAIILMYLGIDIISAHKTLLLIISKLFFSVIITVVMVRINTAYIGKRSNLFTQNMVAVNTMLFMIAVAFYFFDLGDHIVRHAFSIFLYVAIFFFSYRIVNQSYRVMKESIKNLDEQRRIFLNLLSKTGKGSTDVISFDQLIESVLNYAAEVLHAKSAMILLMSNDNKLLVPKYIFGMYPPVEKIEGYAAIRAQYLETLNKTTRIKMGEGYLGRVAKSGRSLFYPEVDEKTDIEQTAKGIVDITSIMVFPLLFKEQVLGVISFCNKEEGNFTQNDYNLAGTLAEQAAIIVNNFRFYNELVSKQRDEKELEIAATIQGNLLPKEVPTVEGLDLFLFSKPAKGVGGDYYDIMKYDENKVAVIIADVAGKGVPAALVMVMIRTILKNILRPEFSPVKIVRFLNRFLCRESTKDRYSTFSFLMLDLETHTLTFTNAGHSPLNIYKAAKHDFIEVDTPGFPIGIDENQKYEQIEIDVDHGDIIVMYTDGVNEAMNESNEQFTTARILGIIKDNDQSGADELGNTIIERINDFIGTQEQHDDMSLIVVKVN